MTERIDDERDPPIEETAFIAGVTVVNIGDVRVARGLSRRHYSSCPHTHMAYDQKERRIWCNDCERDVEGFDAFLRLVEGYDLALKHVAGREARVTEAEAFALRSIAAKNIDKAWRHRDRIPACPHCHHGLFPQDFKREPEMLGIEYARARLKRSGGE